MRRRWNILGVSASILFIAPAYGQFWELPTLPPAHKYGNILIDRTSRANNVKPVFFSHWSHRVRYTCRVCHFELDFAFAANQTEITEAENQAGIYCGTCHDGDVAFGHTEDNCGRCHSGEKSSGKDRFDELSEKLPSANYGNEIDWVAAISNGTIDPAFSIFNRDEKSMGFDKTLSLKADWSLVPPAIFRHDTHNQWLDCANCHPDIFNIKEKATEHFSMKYILEQRFCGVCHYNVASPLDDCRSCHPGMKKNH